MKKIYSLLLLMFFTAGIAQIPTEYYTTATGTGYTLKTQLYNIIKGHTDKGYAGLYTTYQTSDVDNFYEKDGSVLDMYSEKPSGTDPYNYSLGTTQRCGNYSAEGDCYNREHIIPQSTFGSVSPMVSDAHFITPTDGKVNGQRSNYPHGMVGSTTWTSLNGSKLGASAIPGYTGTVFEPIDEFKGDIARMYFYFATRYENTVSGYSFPMFNGTSNQVFTTAFLNMLLTWSAQDPVSAREIARNNAIYTQQNNRNPYIDHPEYVQAVWNATPDTQAPTAPTSLAVTGTTSSTVSVSWLAATDNTGVTSYDIYLDSVLKTTVTGLTTTITGLPPSTTYSFYVIARDAATNSSPVSNTVTGTTTVAVADTQAPTAPTSLTVTATTSSSVSLNWSASTDNVAVTGYDIYMDSVLKASVNGLVATITGLTASTSYSFYIIAKDAATNSSTVSNSVNGLTTAFTAATTACASENFETIPASATSYTTNTWSNSGITWTATDSRTDQTLNTRAITIRNGSLTSTSVVNGIHDLTVTTQLVFTGTSGTFNVRVNGIIVGNVPYSATSKTTIIPGIDLTGSVVVSFTDNSSTTNRVKLDDLSWSCLEVLEVIQPEEQKFRIYPNPSKGEFSINFDEANGNYSIEIFSVLGQKVFEKKQIQSPSLFVTNLKKGIYFIKITKESKSIVKNIIIN